MVQARRYAVYDVFTQTPLEGNQLAVVFDAEGLDTARMQAIAREFQLSETTFVSPAAEARHTAAIRIFTPARELPFAGHPTVGTAVALFEARGDNGAAGIMVLEEAVGPVRCAVSGHPGNVFAEFDLPKKSEPFRFQAAPEAVAAALGLEADEIGFENHDVGGWSAGVPFAVIPLSGLEAARRAWLDGGLWRELFGDDAPGAFVYCRGGTLPGSAFHARMFAPQFGIVEDPATGSALAAFSGAVARFDRPVDGAQRYWVEQGVEMGRPSHMRLELDIEGGAITAARIGGHAIKAAEGTLFA